MLDPINPFGLQRPCQGQLLLFNYVYYITLQEPIFLLFFSLQSAYGRREEFFLFGCVMESTMLDKRISDKSIQFELSMGNAGNSLDGQMISSAGKGEDGDDTSIAMSEDMGNYS